MRCLQRRPIRAQKEGGNREKAWSMLQGTTKKGKKTKALATRAFDRKSGTPGWIRTSGLPLRSSKKLVFNRVPACPVMSEKPWNIKDFR